MGPSPSNTDQAFWEQCLFLECTQYHSPRPDHLAAIFKFISCMLE